MNLKRVLFALLVLMMLPGIAMAQSTSKATFSVVKLYVAENIGVIHYDPVDINLNCNMGTDLNQDTSLEPLTEYKFSGDLEFVEFTVKDFDEGLMRCTLTEEPVVGFDTYYLSTDMPDYIQEEDDFIDELLGGCEWNGVTSDDGPPENVYNGCLIINVLQPSEIEVFKDWIDPKPLYNNPTEVRIEVECTAPIWDAPSEDPMLFDGANFNSFASIEDLDEYFNFEVAEDTERRGRRRGKWSERAWIDDDTSALFHVAPAFKYRDDDSSSKGKDSGDRRRRGFWIAGDATCEVEEETFGAGVIEDLSDCDDLAVAPGVDDECTIVNTRFYEGIPTLDQYGLAILALLMLGMGFVAFRRFA